MAYTEFYVNNAAGSNLNAGSTSGAAAFTYAGGTFVRATGVFTVASGNPQTDGVAVGDFASIYTTAGATVPGLVARVTARNTTTITVSTTVLAGATASVSETAAAATLKIGGAWAGPSGSVAFPFGFMTSALLNTNSDPPRVNIKGGTTYEITAAMTHANNGPIYWEGYTTTVGDGGLAKFGGDSASPSAPYTMLTASGTGNIFRSQWWDDNGGTTGGQSVGNSAMFDVTGTANRIERCRFSNAYRAGLRIGGAGSVQVECEAHNCQRDDANQFGGFLVTEESTWIRCISHTHTAGTDSSGWMIASDSTEPVTFVECIAYNCGNAGWEFSGNHHSVIWDRCAFIDCNYGIESTGAAASTSVFLVLNGIFYSCALNGIFFSNAAHRSAPVVINTAFGDNGADFNANVNQTWVSGSVTLTGDPFVSRSTGNFSLNATSGAGAAVRNAGIGAFLINTAVLSAGASTVAYPDIGAVQHDDTGGAPSGGGGPRVILPGI